MPPQSEAIKQEIDHLTTDQLQQVADFIAFLKFRSKRRLQLDPTQLAALSEEVDEDFALAEAGMSDYAAMLQQEDQQ